MIHKLVLFFVFLISFTAIAQKQQASPYSYFGIGTKFLSKTAEENIMGGVGAATSDPVHLNFSNPAGLAGLRFTSYALGVVNNNNTLIGESITEKASAFSISYIAVGFPLGKNGGMSAGIKASTGVGYNITEGSVEDVEGLLTSEGSGGTNSLFMGLGYTLFKGFSVGLEGNYVFGTAVHTSTQQQQDFAYDIRNKNETVIRGFDTKLGLQYHLVTSKKHALNLAFVVLKSKDISLEESSNIYNGFFNLESESILSQLSANSYSGVITSPLNKTFGVAYGEFNKWQASAEYSFANASSYSGSAMSSNFENLTFEDYQRISVGGYYIPKFNSISSYFSRVIYRAGIKYENTGMQIDNTSINDFGISFGVGLPMGKGLSDLNIGLEYGSKGKVTSTLIQEKYLNVRIGLSLGDLWFRERKID